jgi:hypothetical protein
VFDTNGVPVWWGPKTARIYTFPWRGNIAWFRDGRFDEHRFDGSLVRSWSTVGEPLDFHDLEVRSNGNSFVVSASLLPNVDLSSWGLSANETIVDHVVQEITPAGQVVWSWRASDHIDLAETTAHWRTALVGTAYDPFHWNAIEWTGDGVVLSFRHNDALYKVDRTTGAIEWKLGGSPTPESLTIVNDPVFAAGGGGGFGGQHDGRLVDENLLTLYDNGSNRTRPPRGVTYELDLTARTATLVDSVTQSNVPSSFCCGSFRRLFGGNFVTAWGGNTNGAPDVSETGGADLPVFELDFTDPGIFVYRATPVRGGTWSRDELREGMDAQYGR